jgi:SAM-dependent methyltransferase
MSADEPYYPPRPELAPLIPPGVRVVFDIGCGNGAVAAGLTAIRPELSFYGVEPDRDAAREAKAHLVDVFVGGAEAPLPAHWPAPDLVLFADVLEHLDDPWTCLAQWKDRVPPGTWILVSLPNVLHGSVIGPLFSRGRWDYSPSGVLDRTHLRFFTRDTGLDLVRKAGFEVHELHRNVRATKSFLWERIRWLARTLDRRGWPHGGLPSGGFRLHDIFTLQYYIVAQKSADAAEHDRPPIKSSPRPAEHLGDQAVE